MVILFSFTGQVKKVSYPGYLCLVIYVLSFMSGFLFCVYLCMYEKA